MLDTTAAGAGYVTALPKGAHTNPLPALLGSSPREAGSREH
jgi:hypothetical protein